MPIPPLPLEVVAQIAHEVTTDMFARPYQAPSTAEVSTAGVNIALVCKAWREIGLDAAWRKVVFGSKHDEDLARYILERPALLRRIRCLIIGRNRGGTPAGLLQLLTAETPAVEQLLRTLPRVTLHLFLFDLPGVVWPVLAPPTSKLAVGLLRLDNFGPPKLDRQAINTFIDSFLSLLDPQHMVYLELGGNVPPTPFFRFFANSPLLTHTVIQTLDANHLAAEFRRAYEGVSLLNSLERLTVTTMEARTKPDNLRPVTSPSLTEFFAALPPSVRRGRIDGVYLTGETASWIVDPHPAGPEGLPTFHVNVQDRRRFGDHTPRRIIMEHAIVETGKPEWCRISHGVA
ncbi:hypothetical protein JCM8097_001599 [Rhodosporidiobolus ruineniae]